MPMTGAVKGPTVARVDGVCPPVPSRTGSTYIGCHVGGQPHPVGPSIGWAGLRTRGWSPRRSLSLPMPARAPHSMLVAY